MEYKFMNRNKMLIWFVTVMLMIRSSNETCRYTRTNNKKVVHGGVVNWPHFGA